MENILVIGIAGGTGSGKTTLMNNLIDQFRDHVTLLSHDNYYKRHDDLTYEERCQLNYDEPAALETDLMAAHLDQLRQGNAIDCPVYDFTQHNRSDKTIRIVPRKVIIVDNLKPAKLCGELSEGMILAGDNADGNVKVLFCDELDVGAKIH